MTKKHWKNMKWNCFRWDINADKLVWFNVLSDDLLDDISKAFKKGRITNRVEFSDVVKSWARYHYWCRAEHEVLVTNLYVSEKEYAHKLDVFQQLEANWEIFTDYLIKGLGLDI